MRKGLCQPRLRISLPQPSPAFLHLDENDRLPDQISERSPLPIALLDPLLQRRPGLFQPGLPESLAETVQEHLGLPLLIPLDVRPDPSDEIRKPLRSLGFHSPLSPVEGRPNHIRRDQLMRVRQRG